MDTQYSLHIYSESVIFGSDLLEDIFISSTDDHPNYSIESLVFRKGLYAPNSVDIEIKVTGNPDITKTFTSKVVILKMSAKVNGKDETHEICKNYLVYQFRVVSASSGKTVHLTLFSRDKLLTLDKFSRVYLNQRLGLDILQSSLEGSGFLKGCNVQVLQDSKGFLDISRLQFLHYKTSGTGGKSYEAIQPYRVQYNEDFYSFISRVACQCGEALFFEDGKLTLGPDPKETTPTAIREADIYRIEYPAVENSPLTVNDYHRNFFKNDTPLTDANSLQYSDCEAFDEYYDTFKSDNLPDSMSSEFYWPDIANMVIKTAAPAPGIAFASGDNLTAIEKGFKVAKDIVSITGRYAANRDYVNKQYTANVFDSPGSKTNNYIADQQKNGNDLCQFADVLEPGQLKHNVLADIRKKEMAAARQTITVQIKTPSFIRLKLKLGSRVFIPFYEDITDTSEGDVMQKQEYNKIGPRPVYVVTACRGDFSIKDGSGEKDITEIEIVPLQGDKFVPPYNKCAEFTPVQPQTATVSDASDPRLLGRVRVRYPWQTEKLGSPWVRVLTPFSSGSGSIHFQPHNGDEVMIGYVGGNIERPYVIGSLFGNDKDKIHDNLYLTNNNTISVGSQRLDFREGSMSPFLSSFWSGWSFISQFIPGASPKMKTDHSSGWHGTTRLTDVYGFWKIEGNTAARSVSIDSAWGKVTISAYTGISIEAVGDVTIKGKNINIKAQNNVTIESGIAIKNARKSKNTTDMTKKVVTDIVGDFAKVDLSFIRTIWESVVPPKEGTLKIKSNRYLMLEAGKGVAYDNGEFESPLDSIELGKDEIFVHRPFVSGGINTIETAIYRIKIIYSAVKKYAEDQGKGKEIQEIKKEELEHNKREINNIKNEEDNTSILNKQPIEDLFKQNIPENAQELSSNGKNEFSSEANEREYQGVMSESIREINIVKGHQENLENFRIGNNLDKYVKQTASEIQNYYQWDIDGFRKTFQSVCKSYLSDLGFHFGTGNSWEDKVNGLSYPPKYPKLKALFGKTLESLITGTEYCSAYTDNQSKNLLDGKIIASFEEEKSLALTQDGNWKETDNISLNTLKTLLKRCNLSIPDAKNDMSIDNIL